MKGHESILTIRRAGFKPAAAFISDHGRGHGDVFIEPGDNVEALDLRFLVGMLVHVSVEDTPRGHRIAQACKSASGRCITAFHRPGERIAHLFTDSQTEQQWSF